MAALNDLHLLLDRIDGRGYKAYKEIAGTYDGRGFTLHVDHVQGDPFAAPSKMRLRVPQTLAQVPSDLFSNRVRRIALQDFLSRELYRAIKREVQGRRGTGKSGTVTIDVGGQEVLERTAMLVTRDWVEARIEVGLPAAGRTILGRQAEAILCRELPKVLESSLIWNNVPQEEGQAFVECVENQEDIRRQLEELGLVAFVADGAILPRESGVSDRPLGSREAVAFQSPDSLRVTVSVRHLVPAPAGGGERTRSLSGMGVPRGVTLIVGGGYHGKSTLLRAIERSVVPPHSRRRPRVRRHESRRRQDPRRGRPARRAGRHQPLYQQPTLRKKHRDVLDGRRQREHQPGGQHHGSVGSRGHRAPPRRRHVRHQLHGAGRPNAGPGP